VVGEWRVGEKPRGIIASADGLRLFVTEQPGGLRIIDARTGELVQRLSLGASPEGLALAPDGRLLAVASETANQVVLVDADRGERLAAIQTEGANPEHAAFSPDGRWLYVSAEDAAQVDVIDVRERRQVAHIDVGRRPRGIGFSPDGSRAYVACELDDALHVIDTASQRAVQRIATGAFSKAGHSGGKQPVGSGHGTGCSMMDLLAPQRR
jgi:YVTN family beta-propeller protein